MPTFSVANINPGEAKTQMWLSLIALIQTDVSAFLEELTKPERDPDAVWLEHVTARISGPYLDVARNLCVEGFLDKCHSDYLVFIDSDVVPKPDDYRTLVRTAHQKGLDCVSGVYRSPIDGAHRAVVFKQIAPKLINYLPDELEDMEPDVPVEVEAVGAGFLCLSRSLLERMRDRYGAPLPWFACMVQDGLFHGEDVGFCVRLAEMGQRPWVIPGLVVPHYKIAEW